MQGLPGSNTDYYRNTISICHLCLGMKVTDTRPPCFSQESLILEAEGKPATVLQWMLANVPAGGSSQRRCQRRCRRDVCFPRAIISEATNCRNSQLNRPRPLNALTLPAKSLSVRRTLPHCEDGNRAIRGYVLPRLGLPLPREASGLRRLLD